MGIPKFFRYISERYPLTSQLIEENKIPEFDNLYLDFNGVIHNCSHPNDGDAHFRLSEEQIFTSIFAYVDLLFGKIKPKKLFFIAVDGVAPRAKMNQQRSRRFRTAKEAQEVRDKALAKGEKLPDEKAFDSNCITPGTPFMVRLSEQLRYFINKKITEDSDWRGVEVVLSGHEVPGEGEHKIMEYIRLSRAQEDYNPNVRHCLYGLDADLIMLGLLSHDPHFCLLREEVKFGPSKKKGNASLESINFYLLHLCLMREYLDLEFRDIEPILPFPYSVERVIDDFILLAVFVGNDFLPNLPDLHIHENGLEKLFEVYKKVLPGLGGYINEGGVIETARLQVILDEMADWEREVFEKEYADLSWYKGKQSKHIKAASGTQQPSLVLSSYQRDIFNQVRTFVMENRGAPRSQYQLARLRIVNTLSAKDRAFLTTLSNDLHLTLTWDEYDEDDRNVATLRLPGAILDDLPANGEQDLPPDSDSSDEEDEESIKAVDRVISKYVKAPTREDDQPGDFDARHEQSIRNKMDEWKRYYYKGKLEISYDDPEEMNKLIYRYAEGLQWVMHYYYSGVASWGWFYDYHYAPRISDLRGLDTMKFDFKLGKPFHPFEQLMGVLPVASKDHIPRAYQDLMYDDNSPIRDFYPLDFETDLNGKKQEWEAIVKIPFIDEERLLRAMRSREHRLTKEEAQRNTFGTSTRFTYTPGKTSVYPSSLPGFFPPILRCTCQMEVFDLPTLDGLHLIQGLRNGVLLGSEALAGFPSLQTLPHVAQIGFHGVNVHGSESRNKSIVVHIKNPYEGNKTENIAKLMIGKRIFFGWPFLQEGCVFAVSDSLFKYENMVVVGNHPRVVSTPHSPNGLGHWKTKAEKIEYDYSKRLGVITGPVDVLLHVRPLKGLQRLDTGALTKEYEGPQKEAEYAVQMCLTEVVSEDPRFLEKEAPRLADEFPGGSKVFFLGEHAYGVAAQVSSTTETTLAVILAFFPSEKSENDQFKSVVETRRASRYYQSYQAADMLGLSGKGLSKITASFMVLTSDKQKHNIGLSLKFDAKGLKVLDYTKKDGRTWEYSEKALNLLRDYQSQFPELFRHLERSGDAIPHASDIFGGSADDKVKEIKAWLKSKGVQNLEPVSLFSDQLSKDVVSDLEKLADSFSEKRTANAIKKVVVKGIPRQAVLKPAHAVYRLRHQHYALGDRVTMVKDSGSVPLSAKGVVIGINSKSIDVLWDVPFMSGTTLSDRCSVYRGSSVEFDSCLNLSNPQFIASTNPNATQPPPPSIPFKPRSGPYPAIQPPPGQEPASGFRPASSGPMRIMTNPNRGRGGFPPRNGHAHSSDSPSHQGRGGFTNGRSSSPETTPSRGRGFDRGRGFSRGRGFEPHFERGRGRGFSGRGRGRGDGMAPAYV